jgi:hypothetical protein
MRLSRRLLAAAAGAALLCAVLFTLTGIQSSRSSSYAAGEDHANNGGLLEVHVFVFNRPQVFERLWQSLNAARPTKQLRTQVIIHQVSLNKTRIQRSLRLFFFFTSRI